MLVAKYVTFTSLPESEVSQAQGYPHPNPPSISLGFHNNSHGCQEALFEYILAYELNT